MNSLFLLPNFDISRFLGDLEPNRVPVLDSQVAYDPLGYGCPELFIHLIGCFEPDLLDVDFWHK